MRARRQGAQQLAQQNGEGHWRAQSCCRCRDSLKRAATAPPGRPGGPSRPRRWRVVALQPPLRLLRPLEDLFSAADQATSS